MSRADQCPRLQDDETARLVQERGWQLVQTYVDRNTSGSPTRKPGMTPLMSDARRRAFDVVVVRRGDRLFSGTTIDELTALGIGFVSVTEPFDTMAPDGHHFMRTMSAMAELESQVLAERTRAGLDAARHRGALLGRPRVHIDIERAVELRATGKSLRESARNLAWARRRSTGPSSAKKEDRSRGHQGQTRATKSTVPGFSTQQAVLSTSPDSSMADEEQIPNDRASTRG